MKKQSACFWVMGGVLVLLGLFSIYLALNRIYQVDEAQNVFTSRLIGAGLTQEFIADGRIWIAALSGLARLARTSVELFAWERLIFVGVFWANLLLITLGSGYSLRNIKGLGMLMFVATLAPLWDYGFEIRHDNLLLLGLLISWWLVRTPRRWAFAALGALGVLLQFCSFKAFLYFTPLSLGLLLFPPPVQTAGRPKNLIHFVLGIGLALLAVWWFCSVMGTWQFVMKDFQGSVGVSKAVERFSPWLTLRRPFLQAPFLMGATAAFLWLCGARMKAQRLGFFSWDSGFPEALLLLGSLAILLLNPTPFPYNLVLVIPFAAIAVVKLLDPTLEAMEAFPNLRPLAFGLLMFTHIVPFTHATLRHLDWSNDRQELLMNTAEALTDPDKDRVYDAVGLVPTRKSIGYNWFLHSLNMEKFRNGTWPSVESMMIMNPPSVIIPNYRTNWLGEKDWRFIRSHFVPLSDDFWVLGGAIPPGGGEWTCIHGGRYLILVQTAGGFHPPTQLQVDGAQMPAAVPVELGPGAHHLQIPSGAPGVIVWVGPQLNQVPTLSTSDHNQVFVNWY